MSTPNPNHPDYQHVDPDAPVVEPPRRANPALWVLLLLAVIVLGWWFYGRQSMDPVTTPVSDGVMTSETAPAETLPGSTAPARAEQAASKPAGKPKPVARLTRDPVPLASNEAPRYPAQALRAGVEGSVNVRIELDANGVPTDVQVVERSGERSRDLDRAVVEAARKWRFEPAIKDGKPIAGAVVLPVDFKRQ